MFAYCHFHSFLILHFLYYLHYISQRRNAKNCFRIAGYNVKIRRQVQIILTRAILPRNQSPSVSNSQKFDSWTTFLSPLVGTTPRARGFSYESKKLLVPRVGRSERTHCMAFYVSRLTRRRALGARETPTPRFSDLFCSLHIGSIKIISIA